MQHKFFNLLKKNKKYIQYKIFNDKNILSQTII